MDIKYKLSSFSYLSFENQKMTITNTESKTSFFVEESLLNLVIYLRQPRYYKEIIEYNQKCLKVDEDNFSQTLNYLMNKKFVVIADDKSENIYSLWKENNWKNSLIYHSYTYDYPVLDYSSKEAYTRDQHTMQNYLKIEQEPNIYKTIQGEEMKLPSPRKYIGKSLSSIADKSSIPSEALSMQDLSDLLFYTYGQISSLKFPVTQKLIRRTSPSGGARHPSECYLIFLNNEIVEPGVYYYSVQNHSLVRMKKGNYRKEIYNNCYGIRQFKENSNVVFLHTSIFERNWFRYREPKTYKVIYYDFGHILYNFKLLTSALQLDTYTIGSGLNDSELEELIDIDGFKEGILYFTAI